MPAQSQKSVSFPRDQIALQLGALQMGYVALGTSITPFNPTNGQQAANALVQGRIALALSNGWAADGKNVAGATQPANYADQLDAAVQAVMVSPATNLIKGSATLGNGSKRAVTAKLVLPPSDWSVPMPYAINAAVAGVPGPQGPQGPAGITGGAGVGTDNTATGTYAWVGGGIGNKASHNFATVTAGATNTASGQSATVGGGFANTVGGGFATVGGGAQNAVPGNYGTVGGGQANSAVGEHSTVPGGHLGVAAHNGAFVWSGVGGGGTMTMSTNDYSFTVRAPGGVRFISTYVHSTTVPSGPYNGPTLTDGVILPPNSGAWESLSDSNAKTKITAIKPREILAKLSALPVTEWQYKADPDHRRYIGPMAQDFHTAFGLGYDDKSISTLDSDGVMYAAIQGLVEELKERDKTIEDLKARNAVFESKLRSVEERLNSLPPQ